MSSFAQTGMLGVRELVCLPTLVNSNSHLLFDPFPSLDLTLDLLSLVKLCKTPYPDPSIRWIQGFLRKHTNQLIQLPLASLDVKYPSE